MFLLCQSNRRCLLIDSLTSAIDSSTPSGRLVEFGSGQFLEPAPRVKTPFSTYLFFTFYRLLSHVCYWFSSASLLSQFPSRQPSQPLPLHPSSPTCLRLSLPHLCLSSLKRVVVPSSLLRGSFLAPVIFFSSLLLTLVVLISGMGLSTSCASQSFSLILVSFLYSNFFFLLWHALKIRGLHHLHLHFLR